MSWAERIKTCTYTSPSGEEFTLEYEDVSMSINKKGTVFEFVSSNAVYVQDNKVGAKTYPMIVYFSGDDHDLQANSFFSALSEQGAGILQHPLYGKLTVNAIGEISRADNLKTGANQTAFTIKFIETITNLYPASQTNRKGEANKASKSFNDKKAGEFGNGIDIDSASENQSLISESKALLGSFKSGLDTLADGQASIQKQLNDTFNSINDGIDTLVGDPLTLAFQTINMVKSVSNSTSLIENKLSAYGNLLDDIISPDNTVSPTSYNSESKNSVQTQDLYAAGNVSAMVDSIVFTDFSTREQALGLAAELSDYFFNYMEWKERNFASVGIEDTGAGYEELQNQVAIASSLIIETSFSLKRQKTIILDRDMFIMDFAYTYFGTTDNAVVEEVIVLNGLNNSEIFTIPRGRLMKFYV